MRVAVARDAQQRFQAVIGLFSPFSFPETLQSFVYCHPKEITGRIFRELQRPSLIDQHHKHILLDVLRVMLAAGHTIGGPIYHLTEAKTASRTPAASFRFVAPPSSSFSCASQ